MSADRIRVVHVVVNLQIGGLERLLVEMIRRANRERFEPRVVCLGERGPLADELSEIGVSVDALDTTPGRNARLPLILNRYLRQRRADIVHAHGPRAHFYAALSAPAARNRLIYTKHGHLDPATRRNIWRSRIATKLTSMVVGVSRELANSARTIEMAAPRKLMAIHNGIDVKAFDACNLDRPVGRPVALMVARLAPIKDFETLFRAAALVRSKCSEFELKLVGDGPMRRELESMASKMSLSDVVRFRGNREEVCSELEGSRLFVLSTHSEGLSIALLEAMAARLPVVATDVGGNGEVVADGETGFLVPPKSPEQLAERMLWLIQHPDLAEEMGRAGRALVERHFDVRDCVLAYEQLYRQLVGVDPVEPSPQLANN